MGKTTGSNGSVIKGLIRSSFENFLTHRATGKNSEFKSSINKVLDTIKEKDITELSPCDVYESLKLACQTGISELALESVDCIGKLFLYDYWVSSIRHHFNDEVKGEGERIKIDAPLGPLDSVNLLEQLTESDVFDMLIFSERLECRIYSKLMGTISSTIVETTSSNPPLEIKVIAAFLAALARITNDVPIYAGVVYTKAFRAIYSIYCTSKSVQSQQVAQAALVQITGQVFGVVASRNTQQLDDSEEAAGNFENSNIINDITCFNSSNILEKKASEFFSSREDGAESTLASSDKLSDNGAHSAKLKVTSSNSSALGDSDQAVTNQTVSEEMNEKVDRKGAVYTSGIMISDHRDGDVILSLYVISILCLLTNKSSVVASSQYSSKTSIKMQALGSNLISLHLIHNIIKNYPSVFMVESPLFYDFTNCDSNSGDTSSTLLNACRRLLRLALCTNLINIHPQAFDITTQIVFNLFINHRSRLKRELSIILGEIILPILESKANALTFHKMSIITSLGLALSRHMREGKKALVEAYLNYDCDPLQGTRSAIWTRLIGAISKILGFIYENPNNTIFASQTASSIFGQYIPNPQILIPGFNNTDSIKFYRDAPINSTDYYTKTDYDSLKIMTFSACRTIIECLYQWVNDGNKPEISSSDYNKKDSILRKRFNTSFINDSPSTIKLLKSKKDKVVSGVKVFNSNPRRSLEYLLETEVIPSRSPKDIAHFLSTMSGLDKSSIGEFIGGDSQESRKILEEFMAFQDFADMSIVTSLRKVLQLFKIPGEAQKIDRIMKSFAIRYTECNKNSIFTETSAHLISFSIIMLNTDQHNENVKKRMTKGEFVKNIKSTNDCKDFSENVLEDIYDSIKTSKLSIVGSLYTTSIAPIKPTTHSASFARRQSITQNALIRSLIPKLSDSSFEDKPEPNNAFEPGVNVIESSLGEKRSSSKSQFPSYIYASRIEHIMDMFNSVWPSLFTSLSVATEELSDKIPLSIIFKVFEHCLRIFCIFNLDIEWNAFMCILKEIFANIDTNSVKKCIYSCEVLLKISIEYGNKLSSYWTDIMLFVTRLYIYCEQNNINHAGESGEINSVTDKMSVRSQTRPRVKHGERTSSISVSYSSVIERGDSKSSLLTFKNDATVLNELVLSFQILLDEFFTSTGQLNNASFSALMQTMTNICHMQPTPELRGAHKFILRRTSDLYCDSIERVLFDWESLWPQFKTLLMIIISSKNLENLVQTLINTYGIVVSKFLSFIKTSYTERRNEMIMFFKELLDSSNNPEMDYRIFFTITNIMVYSSSDLPGAWKSVLRVTGDAFGKYRVSADKNYDVDYTNIISAFETVSKYNNIVSIYNDRAMYSLVRLYCDFCRQDRAEISSVKFANLLKFILAEVVTKTKYTDTGPENYAGFEGKDCTFDELEKILNNSSLPLISELWILIPGAFVDIIMNCEIETRTAAMENMFNVLTNNGADISVELWSVIINKIIYHIFETDISLLVELYFKSLDNLYVWISTTQVHALKKFISLFCTLFHKLRKNFKSVLDLLKRHICSPIDITSKNGIRCLEYCFRSIYTILSDEEWDLIIDCIHSLFMMSEVQYIRLVESGDHVEKHTDELGSENSSVLPGYQVDSDPGINKTHLSQMIRDIILSPGPEPIHKNIPQNHLTTIIDCLCTTFICSTLFDKNSSSVESEADMKPERTRKKEDILSFRKKFDACIDVLTHIMRSDASGVTPTSDIAADFFITTFDSLASFCMTIQSRFKLDTDIFETSIYFFERFIEELCSLNEKLFSKCCVDVYQQILELMNLSHSMCRLTTISKLLKRIGSVYIIKKSDPNINS